MFTHFSTSCSLNEIFINKKTVESCYRLNIKINKTCNHFYVNDNLFHSAKGNAIDTYATFVYPNHFGNLKVESFISFVIYILNIW